MFTPVRLRAAVGAVLATVGVYIVLGGGVFAAAAGSPSRRWAERLVARPRLRAVGDEHGPRDRIADSRARFPSKVIRKLLDDQTVAWNKATWKGSWRLLELAGPQFLFRPG